jgi:hypothetical protein
VTVSRGVVLDARIGHRVQAVECARIGASGTVGTGRLRAVPVRYPDIAAPEILLPSRAPIEAVLVQG